MQATIAHANQPPSANVVRLRHLRPAPGTEEQLFVARMSNTWSAAGRLIGPSALIDELHSGMAAVA
jgi:hypothetical protein